MTSTHCLEELNHLVDLVVELFLVGVVIPVHLHLLDDLVLEVLVAETVRLEPREEIVDQSMEEGHVVEHEFGHVHVTQGSHKHDVLADVCIGTLKLTCHHQHGLYGSQREVVVVLLRELLSGKLVEHGHLFGEDLGHSETLRHKHVLANKEKVGLDHRNGSEEGLQVVGKLRTTGITRVHRNVDTHSWDQAHVGVEEVDLLLLEEETVLNGLDLGGDD